MRCGASSLIREISAALKLGSNRGFWFQAAVHALLILTEIQGPDVLTMHQIFNRLELPGNSNATSFRSEKSLGLKSSDQVLFRFDSPVAFQT